MAKKCLGYVSEDITNMEDHEVPINHSHLNSLMESYALKALDVRIVQSSEQKSSSFELSTLIEPRKLNRSMSIQSFTQDFNRYEGFAMPAAVPTREEWVSDDSVRMCMVCKLERFSMVGDTWNI